MGHGLKLICNLKTATFLFLKYILFLHSVLKLINSED